VKEKLEEEEEEFVGNGIRAGNRWKMNSIMSLYKACLAIPTWRRVAVPCTGGASWKGDTWK
jgi:hypothetical protein